MVYHFSRAYISLLTTSQKLFILILYEADDALEDKTIINRHLISVSPSQQPWKQMRATHVWKTVSTITLWTLWKYRCKRQYNSIIPFLLDVFPELWESFIGGSVWALGNMTICQALRRLFLGKGKNYCSYDGRCLYSRSPLKDQFGNIITPGPCLDHPFCI